jgi:hypothetical protein
MVRSSSKVSEEQCVDRRVDGSDNSSEKYNLPGCDAM